VIRYPSLLNALSKDYPIPIIPLTPKIFKLLTKQKFDIVHAQHPFHISWFGKKYAQINKAPFVLTYHTKHDEYAENFFKFLPKIISRDIVKASVEKTMQEVDLVIAPSKYVQQELKEKYPDTKTVTIPTGICFPREVKKSKRKVREKLRLPLKSKILLSVSRLSEEKNIDFALESFAKLPADYFFVILGSGPEEENLKKLASDLGIDSRVLFAGKIPHEKVPYYLRATDVFVFSALNETQGLNLLEALHAGIPVAAVGSKTTQEWLPKEFGLTTDFDIKHFSSKIQEICENPDKGLAKIEQEWALNFSIQNTTKKMVETYKELMKLKAEERR
ncbi:hypothetical protein A2W32_04040, partial [candidate division WWE3 bacterium RBG_16_37_10]